MYIRRKVYSIPAEQEEYDYNDEERYFSDYDDYDYEERLYSTGNNELDEILERAFCEGYEYAQKEFGFFGWAKEKAKSAVNTAKSNSYFNKGVKAENIGMNNKASDMAGAAAHYAKKAAANNSQAKVEKFGALRSVAKGKQAVQSAANSVKNAANSAKNSVSNAAKSAAGAVKSGAQGVGDSLKGFGKDMSSMAGAAKEAAVGAAKNAGQSALAGKRSAGKGISRFGKWLQK